MKKIVDYMVAKDTEGYFDRTVKALIELGYQPFGNLIISSPRSDKFDMQLAQPMVKYEHKDTYSERLPVEKLSSYNILVGINNLLEDVNVMIRDYETRTTNPDDHTFYLKLFKQKISEIIEKASLKND